MIVYVLQHSREGDDGQEDTKLIGVFSTVDKGEAAILALKAKPGFALFPDGFVLERYELDRVWWEEGFATIARDGDEDAEQD